MRVLLTVFFLFFLHLCVLGSTRSAAEHLKMRVLLTVFCPCTCVSLEPSTRSTAEHSKMRVLLTEGSS